MKSYVKRLMTVLFAIVVGISTTPGAFGALLAYEPFTNTPGATVIGSSGGFGFAQPWNSTNFPDTQTSTAKGYFTNYGLSYVDGASNRLTTVGGAAFFQGNPTANSAWQGSRLFSFPRGTNTTTTEATWISFLAVRLGPTNGTTGNPFGKGVNVDHDFNSGNSQRLAVGNSSGAPQNTVGLIPTGSLSNLKPTTNTFGGVPLPITNFIVVRIDHVLSTNDSAYVWVNPSLASEPPTSSAGANSLAGFDFTFNRLRVFVGGNANTTQPYGELVLDEYRVGETFADVAPYGGVVPSFGPIIITNMSLSPGGIVLSGVGGYSNGTYFLLACTNAALPSTNWPAVATNSFDANGNFSCTNALAPSVPQNLYRVLVGTPPPPPPVAPQITQQPTNQTANVGQSVSFYVATTGTGPLTYQWYFNTNTPLGSATSSSLTLANVQTNDAGGYSVLITNGAGSVTSVVAILTVTNPPTPPSITAQPANQSVIVGSNATFTVAASGTQPLSYQWYFNTNIVLTNATNASLSITNAQASNAGTYSVTVTNDYGLTNSQLAALTVTVALPANYYISPTGSDSNSGTNIAAPWFSLSKATAVANPGQLIYMRGGTYNYSSKISISRSGTAASPIRVRAYPGESPVLDFSGQSTSSSSRGIELTGHYWQFYGLEVAYAGDNGMWIGAKSNLVERCVFHDCRDSGLQLANSGTSYNVVLNCDSYRNFDEATQGENADGFAAKFTLGPGNVFAGCRSWDNCDDGWDFWETSYQIVMTNCWTWHNGYNIWNSTNFVGGDGNGFKLGGNYIAGPHYVADCLSFSNRHNGFDQNNNNAGLTLDNCTGFSNSGQNFNLDHGTNATPHVVRNCLSFAGGSSDDFRVGTLTNYNSWQVIPDANASDVQSVTGSLQFSPRQADGSLPVTPFMRPVGGGRLIDAGIDVGRPYSGAAPDLGAFEYPP